MSHPVHLVVPGPLDQRTGGYIYDRRIVEGLRALGRTVTVHELDGAFPAADETARTAAAQSIQRMPAGALPVIDGLALPAFDQLADRLPQPWVALIHHPLALETGLPPDQAAAFAALEQRLLPEAARIIVTSPRTRRDLGGDHIDPARIGVVLPGTDPAPLARGGSGPGLTLLCVASPTPRKGHAVLIEALAQVPELDWRLVCVGSTERDPACAGAIRETIGRLGLEQRVRLVGELDAADLEPYYAAADLFVLASHHEGYGMVLAEALAHGLPVVATTAGAIPDTVPASAGILVPPGGVAALAGALRRVMTDGSVRASLAEGARVARTHLPSWADAARAFAAELDRAAG